MAIENDVFCRDYKKGCEAIAATDLWWARWDSSPVTPGHALIIPKRHVQYLIDLNEQEAAELAPFMQQAIVAIQQSNLQDVYMKMLEEAEPRCTPFIESALDTLRQRSGAPDAFNYGVNDGPEAGQTVPHLHLHIMPRWSGDMENPRGGVRNLFRDDTYGRGE